MDDRLGTLPLVRLLASRQRLPVVAAGGIMDGAGVAAGRAAAAAVAAQLGTAFVGCPESSADAGSRAALRSDAAFHTTMTRVISGRPARCPSNASTRRGRTVTDADVPE